MPLRHDEGWAIPFDAPFYPSLPAWFRDVQFQYVFFRADPVAVARLLPEPLEASPDGGCVAMGFRIPFTTAYGAFNEAALLMKCSFRRQFGWYQSHVWHDGPRGIAAGREIYGTAKIFSELDVRLTDGSMLTRASMGGVPVVTISSTMEQPVEIAAIPDLSPTCQLKLIPRADRPGPAIKQLIEVTSAAIDFEGRAAYRGRGTVHFEPSPFGDLSGLQPREYGAAYSFVADYGEGFAEITYDYLADD